MRYLFFILLFSGCFAFDDFHNTSVAYDIKEGEHKSKRNGALITRPSTKSGSGMIFDARFTTGCFYDPAILTSPTSINKTYGMTDCNAGLHGNSLRFGWRSRGYDTLEVFAYWYVGGNRGWQKVGETTPYKTDHYELNVTRSTYQFIFNGDLFEVERRKSCKGGFRFRAFPYHGGPDPAPQDIRIYIAER